MGFFDEDYDVKRWESLVKGAQDKVAAEKRNREQAKACGNYKNASKSTRLRNGKLGNCYDVNVQAAEIGLQYAKENLARAKEKAREAKKRKQEKEKEDKKRKQEEAKRTAAASKASSSSSSRSSRSSSTSTVVKSSVVGAAVATSLLKSSSSNSEPTTYSHSESSYSTGGTVSSNNICTCEQSKPAKSSSNGLVTLILCIFFGVIGAHRFYVGKTGTGILQFFTAGGYLIWTFIDLVHILTGKFTDSEGNVIRVFN
jgi:hypothetical protein